MGTEEEQAGRVVVGEVSRGVAGEVAGHVAGEVSRGVAEEVAGRVVGEVAGGVAKLLMDPSTVGKTGKLRSQLRHLTRSQTYNHCHPTVPRLTH